MGDKRFTLGKYRGWAGVGLQINESKTFINNKHKKSICIVPKYLTLPPYLTFYFRTRKISTQKPWAKNNKTKPPFSN